MPVHCKAKQNSANQSRVLLDIIEQNSVHREGESEVWQCKEGKGTPGQDRKGQCRVRLLLVAINIQG